MNIFILPIEPISERYPLQWWDQIPNGFKALGNNVHIVEGKELTKTVTKGTVLDTFGTNYMKSNQISQICELFQQGKVKNGDRFFVCDIWFPGIEAIKYMADLSGIKVKIFGVWHAGSITIEDFMAPCHSWAKYFEMGFLNMCDGIFVGSDYSRDSILERLLPYVLNDIEARNIAEKIHAFGLPIYFELIDNIKVEKKPRILFASRFDIEKRPNIFLDAIEVLLAKKLLPTTDVEFMFCTGRDSMRTNEPWLLEKYNFLNTMLLANPGLRATLDFKTSLTKEEYFKLSAESTAIVQCTMDETFGYVTAEALALGTIPIVPNKFCYPEIFDGDETYMYNNFDGLVDQIAKILQWWNVPEEAKLRLNSLAPSLKEHVAPYRHVLNSWDKVMKTG